MAGPTARPTLKVRLDSATACPNSSVGTRSGWMACQAGLINAAPTPSENVSPSSSAGVTRSVNVNTAKAAAHTSIQAWVDSRTARRLKTSAMAPAGSPRSRIGRRLAVWISATRVGDVVRSPMSQAAATVWKNVPMFEPS